MFTELEKYLSQVKSDKSPHTLRSYTNSLTRFCNTCEILYPEQISTMTSAQVQDYLYGLKNNGLSASTVNSHARNLIVFFRWLTENGHPNDLHTKMFRQSKTIKDVPTPEEVKAMLATTKTKRERLLLAMLSFTGMRREEITNVKISDISGCFVTINGKGRKQRKLALHEDVCKLLNEYLIKRDADFEYLFYTRKSFAGRGDAMPHKLTAEAIRQTVKRAMRNAGIPEERVAKMSAHSMRRFFAVYLLKNNASLSKIQLLLGHSSATTTAIYLQSAGAEIADEDVRALPSLIKE